MLIVGATPAFRSTCDGVADCQWIQSSVPACVRLTMLGAADTEPRRRPTLPGVVEGVTACALLELVGVALACAMIVAVPVLSAVPIKAASAVEVELATDAAVAVPLGTSVTRALGVLSGCA